MSPIYRLTDVQVSAGTRTILTVPELVFETAQFVAIAGPNGAGKSTLLSILSGLRRRYQGTCLFLEKDVRSWARRDFAKQVALVAQHHSLAFPYTVEEVVLMGRMPHAEGWLESPADLEAVSYALDKTGATSLRGRDFRTLSGGEQQRVILASALAQMPRILLLDEPTVYLDLQYQVHLFRLLTELRQQGVLVIAITHDLNLAAGHADRLLLLNDGRLVAQGKPEAVLTGDRIREVFRVDAELHHNDSGKLWMHYGP